ncbi:hypothetical protein [Paucihalobacter sp.]|uniref:hypothetical protein n=1 Tax=Paucihalobacter sp. TaxID=2850405 RepID=UPI002FE35C20
MLITLLLSAMVVMSMYLVEIKLKDEQIAESYFDITPQPIEDEKNLPKLDQTLPTTNSAFDEDDAFKEMMRNFKTVNRSDFETETDAETDSEETDLETNDFTDSETGGSKSVDAITSEEQGDFNAVSDLLKNLKSNAKSTKNVNANSTLTFSLKDRNILSYNTPRYLCEESGKIVVNITVNSQGKVTDTYINKSSSTKNQCLTDHALEYANAVLFNKANLGSQLGTITFYFKGKN